MATSPMQSKKRLSWEAGQQQQLVSSVRSSQYHTANPLRASCAAVPNPGPNPTRTGLPLCPQPPSPGQCSLQKAVQTPRRPDGGGGALAVWRWSWGGGGGQGVYGTEGPPWRQLLAAAAGRRPQLHRGRGQRPAAAHRAQRHADRQPVRHRLAAGHPARGARWVGPQSLLACASAIRFARRSSRCDTQPVPFGVPVPR